MKKERVPWVAVAGAGAAGMAAALAIARAGVLVRLFDRRSSPGGIVRRSLIHTLGGLLDGEGSPVYPGLPSELMRRLTEMDPRSRPRRIGRLWVFCADPLVYTKCCLRWLEEEKRLRVDGGWRVVEAVEAQGRASRLTVRRGEHRRFLSPAAVVDATGDGSVVRSLGRPMRAAPGARIGGWILQFHRERDLGWGEGENLRHALKDGATSGDVPAMVGSAWVDRGVAPGEFYVKVPLSLAGGTRRDLAEAVGAHRDLPRRLLAWLRKQPGFEGARRIRTGQAAARDSGRAIGDYGLSVHDLRHPTSFDGPTVRAVWPMEFWDQERGPRMEYLPGTNGYSIPETALHVKGVSNVWVAGRCLSADPLAQSSARVAGTCWATGEAAGAAAARWVLSSMETVQGVSYP